MGLQTDRLPKQSRRHFGHPRMHSHQSGASVLGEVIKDSTKFQVSAEIHKVHCQCLVIVWIDAKLLNVAPIFIKCVFPNACAHISFPYLEVPPDISTCHETRQAHPVLPSNQREIGHQAMSSLIGQAPSHLTRKMFTSKYPAKRQRASKNFLHGTMRE